MDSVNVLVIDVETTGLHPGKGAITIEIGAVLWNLEHKAMLQCVSTLRPCQANPVQNINGIDPILTQQLYSVTHALMMIEVMALDSLAIIAHNAQFDHKFMKEVTGFAPEFWEIPWICTKSDIKWPFPLERKRLQDVCNAAGVPYLQAHRSLTDCFLLAKCLEKVPDLKQQIQQITQK